MSRYIAALLLLFFGLGLAFAIDSQVYRVRYAVLQHQIAELTVKRIEGTREERKRQASILAARARMAIFELRRALAEDDELDHYIEPLLRALQAALR